MEKMLQGSTENSEAENFFQTIMTNTGTDVSWPSKIKIGAKSKKDPYVTISGKIEAVKEAKELVMAELDVKTDRVTLKLDVPHTDHSHIIGKKGCNIQKVMDDTGCHIHFPDSNRNNPVEKSNLVSIAGQPPQVEWARARIRELVPLCLAFQVPMQMDSQAIRHVEDAYGVSVQVRHNSYASTVSVKGNEVDADSVKEATRVLMDRLISPNVVPVCLTMEVGPQNHAAVAGTDGRDVDLISQMTGTNITFPDGDSSDPRLQKKGGITISGSIEGVHLARQKIIGSLPLALSFDLGYDVEFDTSFIKQVMDMFDVNISTKPKVKQLTKNITIKGKERKVGDLFEARRCLLGAEFKEPGVQTYVPAAYAVPEPGYQGFNLMSIFPASSNGSFRVKSSPPPLIPHKMLNWSSNDYQNFVPVPVPYGCRPVRGANSIYSGRAPSVCSSSSGISSTMSSTLTSPNQSPPHGSPTNFTSQRIGSFFGTEAGTDKDVTNLSDRSSNTSIARLQELFGGSLSFSDESSSFGDRSCEGDLESNCLSRRFPSDYDRKQILANIVVKEKNLTQARVPSNNYVGYGFSQSMPAKMLQEQKSLELKNTTAIATVETKRNGVANNHCNFLNSMDPSLLRPAKNYCDLSEFLAKIGCEKYEKLFREQEVDMKTFLTLDEKDLKILGVPTFGARRKMLEGIKNIDLLRFSAAPGAERRASKPSLSHCRDPWFSEHVRIN